LKIVFFGTPEFAMPSLRSLMASKHELLAVVAQPDRPAGRGMKVASPPTVVEARAAGVAVLQPSKLRDPQLLDTIRNLAPDAGVVIAYGRILPESLLQIPARGFLNVHGSLLPKYRGAAPIQRAIEAGESETGITIMKVDAELDHGPVMATRRIAIHPDERSSQLAPRLAGEGASLLLKVLDALENGSAVERAQAHSEATYAAKLQRAEGRLDWQLSARTLYDRFRAFDPWPGVFFEARGEAVKVLEMRPSNAHGNPGSVVQITPRSAIVAAGSGAIEILRLQRAGKPPIDAAGYFRDLQRHSPEATLV